MKKKISSFIFVLGIVAVVLGMLSISVCATTYSGSCGDNVTYTLDTETGVLTISGTGNMWNDYDVPWEDYRDFVNTVVIEDGVTSIGDDAFSDCSSLTSITIPDSVTSIGNCAFSWCDSLTSITIPDSVTSIDYAAFMLCDNLVSVTIGDGVISIGTDAFYDCSSLISVTIGSGVTSIGDSAFNDCESLTQFIVDENNANYSSADGVLFNKNKTKILQYPAGATNAYYAIPDSVISIGNSAFSYCYSLTSITIGSGVTSIGDSAFSYCYSLTSITIPDGVTSIGDYAFSDCSGLTSVTIPDSVTSIGYYAFSDCSGLTSVTIPDSVTSIGISAFSWCYSLTSITIGSGVTSIGYYAFFYCDSLTSITLPKSVTSIGASAFEHCYNLNNVNYYGSETDWANITIGDDNTYLTSATRNYIITVTFDGVVVETDGRIVLGTDNGDGTYALPENVVGYYFDDKFVDAGKYDVAGGETIVTVYFNVAMIQGAQVRYGGGLDENGKITSGNGLRFIATVDRSNFDAEGYGIKLTAEGSEMEIIIDAEKWQNDTTFTAALTDIAESNYIRKFTATPFAKVKYDDGKEQVVYGTETVTRSIYQVSAGLLKDETQTDSALIDVLNAYANQTGIRLVVVDGELKANTAYTKSGAYALEEDELHFAVSDAAYDKFANKYSVVLTPQVNAKIITDNDFWYEYIRINNNNSLIKDKVTVEKLEGTTGAVKVTFDAEGLIKGSPDRYDNIIKDPADDEFDGESNWN